MDVHPPHGGIHSWRDFFIRDVSDGLARLYEKEPK